MFRKLYEPFCLLAGQQSFQHDQMDGNPLPRAFTRQVCLRLQSLFQRLRRGESAITIHTTTLLRYKSIWASIRCRETCLVCLAMHPEYKPPCGHWICETCLQVFGSCDEIDPDLWSLDQCILCAEDSKLLVRIKPSTAGHSVLCIDGGGGRGIVPIIILCMLQSCLDLEIPIQEFFTLVYGSSAGKLICLLLLFCSCPSAHTFTKVSMKGH